MNNASAGEPHARQHLAAVSAYRANMTERLLGVIASAFPDTRPPHASPVHGVVGYALAHHAVEGMREGALQHDAAMVRQACAVLEKTQRSNLVAVGHTDAIKLTEMPSDMPLWAASTRGVDSAPDEITHLVKEASAAAVEAGYGWLVQHALGVVVTLHERRFDEATSSWTVSRLPCTMYTDYYPDGPLLGKDLVHEAAHSWLNECLTVSAEQLDDSQAAYWSPWKQRARTAFGLLHSAFAFSCVINYLTWLRDNAPGPQPLAYCDRRLPDERARLAEAAPGIESVLEDIIDDPIRNMVLAEFASATSPGR